MLRYEIYRIYWKYKEFIYFDFKLYESNIKIYFLSYKLAVIIYKTFSKFIVLNTNIVPNNK